MLELLELFVMENETIIIFIFVSMMLSVLVNQFISIIDYIKMLEKKEV